MLMILTLSTFTWTSSFKSSLKIEHATISLLPLDVPSTAIYFQLTNTSEHSFNLKKVKITDLQNKLISDHMELRRSYIKNGLWQREYVDHLFVEPYQQLNFNPSSLHIVAKKLTRPIQYAEILKLHLEFYDGPHLSAPIAVSIPSYLSDETNKTDLQQPIESQPHLLLSMVRVRPTMPKRQQTAVYLNIENTTDTTVYLLSAKSPIAENIEFSKGVINKEKMNLTKLKQIKIPARKKVKLAPGKTHLRMLGLQKSLGEGDTVPLILYFSSNEVMQINAPVQKKLP